MTTGTMINATPSMIERVKGLEEELNAVRLYDGFSVDGIRFGKRPTTPKSVAATIARAEPPRRSDQAARRPRGGVRMRAISTAKSGIAKRPDGSDSCRSGFVENHEATRNAAAATNRAGQSRRAMAAARS